MKRYTLFFLVFVFFVQLSCKNNEINNKTEQNQSENYKNDLKIKVKIYPNKNILKIGDTLSVAYTIETKVQPDSILFLFDNKILSKITKLNGDTSFVVKSSSVGTKTLNFLVFYKNKKKTFSKKITLLSDITPQKYSYKIINEYPHDNRAYTQGLCYEDGIFYEATGLETKSSIRKVNPETGEVLYSRENPSNIFGEGIAILGNKLYQITWKNHVAFVYDKNSFKEIDKFGYNTEGWGLTTDGNVLYMSDGSNKIYVRDPQTFQIIRQIEVFDNKNKVSLLNELEYIEGKIWANIYTKDYIAIIDPESGKVIGYIYLNNILAEKYKDRKTDVLNGIAYDKEKNRIFVTGKNWARLFEIKIIRN